MKDGYCRSSCSFLVAAIFHFLCLQAVYAMNTGPTIEMSADKVEINSFYHGTEITLHGTVPATSKVALLLLGERKEHVLKQKGKVGPLWMNVGTVTIQDAPEMYFLLTSADTVEELAAPEVLIQYCIGYDALRESAVITQENSNSDLIFREFIKLKENMGLYNVFSHSITLRSADEGSTEFKVSIPIPALAPPGEYEVSLYCFEKGQLASNVSTKLIVEKVGLPKKLSALAFDHAAMYGVVAIVVAMAVGLFMGFLFGSKGKGGH